MTDEVLTAHPARPAWFHVFRGCVLALFGVTAIVFVLALLSTRQNNGGDIGALSAEVSTSATVIDTSPVQNVPATVPVLHTATPAPTSTPLPTLTPHYRLTAFAGELAEANGELAQAQIAAEIVRLETDAESYHFRLLAEIKASATAANLSLQQTEIAIVNERAAWTATPAPSATPQLTLTEIGVQLMAAQLERQQAEVERADDYKIIAIIVITIILLGSFAGSAWARWLFERRMAAERAPVTVEAEDWQPQSAPLDARQLARVHRLHRIGRSRRQIEEAVFGYSNARVGEYVQGAIDYLDAPSPTALTYAGYCDYWSSRSDVVAGESVANG